MTTAVNAEKYNDDMMVVQVTLTSDSSGDASVTTSNSYKGMIVQLEYEPDGSDTPATGLDLKISDTYAEVLSLSNLGTSTTVKYQDDLHNGIACFGPLTFTGDEMGSAKTAVFTAYIIRIQ